MRRTLHASAAALALFAFTASALAQSKIDAPLSRRSSGAASAP